MDLNEGESSRHKNRGTPASWRYVPQKRRLLPEDPFYKDGNIQCSLRHKQTPLEDVMPAGSIVSEFKCQVSECTADSFNTINDFETHYNGAHRNVCDTCSRAFPTTHLLDIHVQEWHDSLFQILAQKQPMFLCLVQACGIKFTKAEERKQHLVKEHKYPEDFKFDQRASKNGKLPNPCPTSVTSLGDDFMDVGAAAGTSQESEGNAAVTSANRQYRVPKNICFGRGGARTFQRACSGPHAKHVTTSMLKNTVMGDAPNSALSNKAQLPQESRNTDHCPQFAVDPTAIESEVSMDTR